MTPTQKQQLVSTLYAEYRREAVKLGQRSPYRQKLYIEARMRGKNKKQALEGSRRKYRGTDKKVY